MSERNWAGNYEYKAARLHRPKTVEEIQALIHNAEKVRALGSRHSFNDIADTPADLVSTEHLLGIEIDKANKTVTVGGGVRYGDLAPVLDAEGFALPNLASLPHISVAGACATATHGSGEKNGNLATPVSSLEIVTADGSIVKLPRDEAAVNLGGLGIVTRVTLDLLPTFEVSQTVYENLPLANLEKHFDEVEASGYSVSFFTTWRNANIEQVWVKRKDTESAPDLFGAKKADGHRHPIGEISPVNCTPQMGIPGPWYERLPHFGMDFTPSSGEELQSEFYVPRENALDALHAIDGMRDHIVPLLLISEIRAIAADELWMSPCYRQSCIAIHFTWKQDWERVRAVLPIIERTLKPFKARPHWGKLFTMPVDETLFPRLPEFGKLLQTHDPEGKFRNAFLDRNVFGKGI